MKKKFLLTFFTAMVLLSLVIMPAVPVTAAPAGNWLTDFTLFNLSASSNTIQIKRYTGYTAGAPTDPGVDVVSYTMDGIGAGKSSYYYNPAADNSFPQGFKGSIVISASQPLAGTVTIANDLGGSQFASDAYSAVSTPQTTQYLPIIMGKLGVWNTRISIQNAGGGPANVTVTYIGAGAPAPDVISNLPANMTVQLDQAENSGMTNFNGSAKVESTQPVAVVVEEYRTSGGMLVMYNGTADADSTVYMPGYIDQSVWGTDFTIVNTGAATTATVHFANSAATLTGPIPAGGSVYLNESLPTGWSGTFPMNYYGAATVTTTGGVKVIVAYNIANTARGGPGNLGVGYVGFPQTGASKTVIVPLIENNYSSGWNTTFSVQSTDGTPAKLTIAYSGNVSPVCNPCSYDMNTKGEAAHTFNQGNDGHIPSGFIGGATITSDKNIVVIADQNVKPGTAYSSGDAAAGFVGFKQ